MVNGPAGDALCWDAIDWRFHEDNVRRVRQRIFTAARDGDLGTLRNLQKLMLRSWSNTLLSVRQATQRNAGRTTAGVDGEIALSSLTRAELAVQVHRDARSWRPLPVKRVYIPKAGNRAKLRPLGIPVIADRCHQGRVRAALEPEWEARFEPRSYGFRPGRGCHDAISAVFNTCKGPRAKRVWALDADLAAAFDKIDHNRLLDALGSFPARDMIRRWLTAGGIERGKGFAPTEEGTPQGGVISPLLLNVALHGLESAAGVRYITAGRNAGDIKAGSPVVIRYADDMIALCHSQRQAEQVQASLAEWLAPRGLVFNEDKTAIVPLSTGFDFLGFNVRRYGAVLLINHQWRRSSESGNGSAARCAHCADPMRRRSLPRSLPSSGGGRPTTGEWCRPGHSNPWTTTCGSSPTSGPHGATPTNRTPGFVPATSGSSTSSGTTTGCSATRPAALTWSSFPGPTSSGTPWSPVGRLRTTPPWPSAGPLGGDAANPRWMATRCVCSPSRTATV